MQIGLIEVRNSDYQDKHFYLLEIKTKNMKILTLGKFNERQLVFEYYNYYTNEIETVDIFETRKLVGVFSIERMIRDLDYHRSFENN